MSSSTDPHTSESMTETENRDEDYELKSHANTLIPIGKLPPELMVQIFFLVVQSQYSYGKPSRSWYSTKLPRFSNSWVAITCVCRQWREIAIQTATLWTVVNPTHPEWTKILLERSKSFPLTLFAPRLLKTNPDACALALQHINRFSSVAMELTISYASQVRPLEQQTLPFLQHIVFTPPHSHQGQPMPDIFDQCHLPALKSLTLSYYWVLPSSPMFARTLTDLSISEAADFAVLVIVEVLTKTPSLVNLSLHANGTVESSFSALPPLVAETQRISLPCLKRCSLALLGDLMKTVAVLNHLSFPSSASLDIAIWPPDECPTELFGQGLVPTLTGENRIGPIPQYRTCFIDFVNMFLHLSHELYPQDGFSIWIPFNTSGSPPASSTPCFFEVLQQSSLAIESVESLVINDERCEHHPQGWYTALSKMPNLSQVEINLRGRKGLSPSSLRVFLSNVLLFSDGREGTLKDGDDEEAKGIISQELVLPHLKTFVLSRSVFPPTLMNVLLDVLEKRKARGKIIESLVIQGLGGVRDRDLERLRRVAGDVTWAKC